MFFWVPVFLCPKAVTAVKSGLDQPLSIRLPPNVSTTSLTLPCIVSTFHKDTCNLPTLHTWCGRWMTVWIGPHLTFSFSLPRMTPSLLDMALLYDITLFHILHDLIEAESVTAKCPSWCKPVGRRGNWVLLPETSLHSWTVHICCL